MKSLMIYRDVRSDTMESTVTKYTYGSDDQLNNATKHTVDQ